MDKDLGCKVALKLALSSHIEKAPVQILTGTFLCGVSSGGFLPLSKDKLHNRSL